jgi:type IV secretion system protein VirB8
MNAQTRKSLNAYYAEAASWNRDRVGAIQVSRRAAWWVASAATGVALLEAAALVLLLPLKTVEPYTLLVDRTTGYVQALKPLDQPKISPDSALTQSFLVQYVIAREEFDLTSLSTDYRKVALFSAGTARSSYLETMRASDPRSPLQLYPRTTTVDVRVKSVSPMGADSALVRFDTVRTDSGAEAQPASSWVALIHYRYSTAPMKLGDRFVNPLGFEVTSYRRDAEAEPVAVAASPPANPVEAAVAPYYSSSEPAARQRGASQ